MGFVIAIEENQNSICFLCLVKVKHTDTNTQSVCTNKNSMYVASLCYFFFLLLFRLLFFHKFYVPLPLFLSAALVMHDYTLNVS